MMMDLAHLGWQTIHIAPTALQVLISETQLMKDRQSMGSAVFPDEELCHGIQQNIIVFGFLRTQLHD